MVNISIYGAGHLTKSMLEGLARISEDTKISIFNRTESKVYNLSSVYRNINKEESLVKLIRGKTILFCIVPGNVLMNLDLNEIGYIRQTNSIIVSCVNGLSLEILNRKFKDIKIIRLLPNINWRICEGTSLFDYNDKVTKEELNIFHNFLSPITRLYRVKNEKDFDKIGTLTTCSPGLFSTLLDYFIKYFELESIEDKEIFYESVKGTIDYILRSKKEPNIISSEVANKGGLTEVGINALTQQFPSCMEVVSKSMNNKIKVRKEKFEELLL